jgi:hypothetical protein
LKEEFGASRVVARLIDIDVQFEFDLVLVEDARPAVLAMIEQEGVDL